MFWRTIKPRSAPHSSAHAMARRTRARSAVRMPQCAAGARADVPRLLGHSVRVCARTEMAIDSVASLCSEHARSGAKLPLDGCSRPTALPPSLALLPPALLISRIEAGRRACSRYLLSSRRAHTHLWFTVCALLSVSLPCATTQAAKCIQAGRRARPHRRRTAAAGQSYNSY